MKRIKELRKGALFVFMDEVYQKGEYLKSIKMYIVIGVSEYAISYGRLGEDEMVEKFDKEKHKIKMK